ncbi:ribonuclease H-like domain-containing protein [Tanacetum coccineum]
MHNNIPTDDTPLLQPAQQHTLDATVIPPIQPNNTTDLAQPAEHNTSNESPPELNNPPLEINNTPPPASVSIFKIPSTPTVNLNPVSVHPMVTRFRVRTNRPTQCLNLHVSSIAFNDPNSQNAMFDEYNALIKNNTWTLVPRPTDTNIVRCMWLFRHKYLVDDTLSRYKARLVVNGSTHIEGIDVDETFSPVVKLGTIQTVLSLATSRHWPVHQLDVKNAFLHSDLAETVYMHQPPGFRNFAHLDYVCLLQRQGTDTAYLLMYVDDIVLTASAEILLQRIIASLHHDRTPVDTESKLGDDGDPVSDPKLYMSLVGSLQYLTFTRPDISYAVQQICLYMHDPREPHFSALKRILRYVRGTLDYGLQLFSPSTTSLVAYSDADLAGCPTTRRSTFGNCVFLDNNLLSWSSKRKLTLSRSSVLLMLLRRLVGGGIYYHQRTKHIEIDIHFVCDLVAAGQVRVLHVPSHVTGVLREWGFVEENKRGSKSAHKDSATSHVDMKEGNMRQVDVKEGVMDGEDAKEAYVNKDDMKESQI